MGPVKLYATEMESLFITESKDLEITLNSSRSGLAGSAQILLRHQQQRTIGRYHLISLPEMEIQ